MAQQTAKEKAEELVINIHNIPSKGIGLYEAKQCGLIAVKEIIRTLNWDIKESDLQGLGLINLLLYWREVEKEIEKL